MYYTGFNQLWKNLGDGLHNLYHQRIKIAYEHLGWFGHIIPDDISCPNNYNYHTWGIEKNFGHPDFQICFPCSPDTSHLIVQTLVGKIREGIKFEPGDIYYDDILGGGYRLKFINARENGRDVLRLILPNPSHGYEGKLYEAQFTLIAHDGTTSCPCPDCRSAGKSVHPCADCGIDTTAEGIRDNNYYMATDEIWNMYGAGDGFLCLSCLEKRLGRPFTDQDFNDSILNRVNRAVQKIKNFKE